MIYPNRPVVVVGMSGGVDSSVSALLLKQQGAHVIGLFMKNWEEQDATGQCCSAQDYDDVVRVCDQIGIPHYSVNFAKEYWDNVFSCTLRDFQAGHTPNPDVLCNREIKFKVLLERARLLGGEFLATGHYCRIGEGIEGEKQLLKGIDSGKDQSYFLHAISSEILKQVLFPIGHLPKNQVRAIAKEHNLVTAEKKDSTGLCFIGERDFKQFLSQHIPIEPGNFEDLDGKVLGRHDGVAFYTIGQRRGMGIGGAGEAWFVVGKDPARNVVFLAQGADHPALYCDELVAADVSWVGGQPPKLPYRCKAKVRYRQEDQECIIERIEDNYTYVRFTAPQRAVTKQQSIVFYDDEVCLGGGVIHTPGPSYHTMNKIRH